MLQHFLLFLYLQYRIRKCATFYNILQLTVRKEGTLLILCVYKQHQSQWKAIIDDIKVNMDHLHNIHQQLYRWATTRQLRDRISSKFLTHYLQQQRYVCLLSNYSECLHSKDLARVLGAPPFGA